MRPEIEDLLKQADEWMNDSSASDTPSGSAFAANQAIVTLLGGILQEVAMLREDLDEKS